MMLDNGLSVVGEFALGPVGMRKAGPQRDQTHNGERAP